MTFVIARPTSLALPTVAANRGKERDGLGYALLIGNKEDPTCLLSAASPDSSLSRWCLAR
jgi:hypothetical protein